MYVKRTHLNCKSMQDKSPKPPKTARKAVVLHTFGVQVLWAVWSASVLSAGPCRSGPGGVRDSSPKQPCRTHGAPTILQVSPGQNSSQRVQIPEEVRPKISLSLSLSLYIYICVCVWSLSPDSLILKYLDPQDLIICHTQPGNPFINGSYMILVFWKPCLRSFDHGPHPHNQLGELSRIVFGLYKLLMMLLLGDSWGTHRLSAGTDHSN